MQRSFTAIIEKCNSSELYIGWIPGLPGAHSQGATRDELQRNLEEVVAMLFEDGEPRFESEFIGTLCVDLR